MGSDDGRDVELPRVTHPPVGPAAENDQATGLVVVDPSSVLSWARWLSHDIHRVPNELPTVHNVHRVDVVHDSLLSTESEELVVGNGLNGAADVVADAHSKAGGGHGVLPCHGLQIEEVHITEGLGVVPTARDDQGLGEVGDGVVEPRGWPVTLGLDKSPGHGGVVITEFEHSQVLVGLSVAAVAAEEVYDVVAERASVVRSRGRGGALDVGANPHALVALNLQDPNIVVPGSRVDASENQETVVRDRDGGVVGAGQRRHSVIAGASRLELVPHQKVRTLNIQVPDIVKGRSNACKVRSERERPWTSECQ